MTVLAPRRRSGASKQRHWSRWFTHPLAWALAVFNLFVLVWIIVESLQTTKDIALNPLGWPKHLLFSNYRHAWAIGDLGAGVTMSVLLVLLSGIGTLLLAAPAAYGLTRFGSPLAPSHIILFAIGLAVPGQVTIIPLYVAFDHLHLLDSLSGLVIANIAGGIPLAVFLLTAFFRSLPPELEEAAAIDGAGTVYTFARIMLPLARSGLITVFVLQAIGVWGEVFLPLVFLRTKSTISLSVLSLSQTIQYTGAQYAELLAGIVMIIIPVLALYLVLSRRMLEGISAGYSK